MARQADYAAKITVLEEKIAKKSNELKAMKAELADWKMKKANEEMKELHEFMADKDMTAARALELIQKGLEKEAAEAPQEQPQDGGQQY